MFDLESQASAIVEALKTVPAIETATYIDRDDEAMRQPVEMPAAMVALEKLNGLTGQKTITGPIVWTVIVRSKRMEGAGGCLPVLDAVIDKLHAYNLPGVTKQLRLNDVEFFNQRAGSVAYAVRFTTIVTGTGRSSPCGL